MNKNQISLQVYTARNFKPYEDIFKFLSEKGLENVELFEVEAFDETKDLLEKYDLTAKSSHIGFCLLYTSPSPRDKRQSRMPSSA